MLTGKDYPHLCSACRSAIDDMADLYADDLMEDTDNEEAACDAVYDHRMFCGGGECINKPQQGDYGRTNLSCVSRCV